MNNQLCKQEQSHLWNKHGARRTEKSSRWKKHHVSRTRQWHRRKKHPMPRTEYQKYPNQHQKNWMNEVEVYDSDPDESVHDNSVPVVFPIEQVIHEKKEDNFNQQYYLHREKMLKIIAFFTMLTAVFMTMIICGRV